MVTSPARDELSIVSRLMAMTLMVDSPLWAPGRETVVLAGSVPQARIPFRMARRLMHLEGEPDQRSDGGLIYSVHDSPAGLRIIHKATGTALRVMSSDSKRAFGLGDEQQLLVGDEPGSWQERAGGLMFDALETAGGKTAGMKVS